MSETLLSLLKAYAVDGKICLADFIDGLDKYVRMIQTCQTCGNIYLANSHEYPCPDCELKKLDAERESNRVLLTQVAQWRQESADAQAEISRLKTCVETADLVASDAATEVLRLRAEIATLKEKLALAVKDTGGCPFDYCSAWQDQAREERKQVKG